MAVRRLRDIKIRYTKDMGSDKIIAQRVYVNVDDGTAITPITPLLLARQVPSDWVVEPKEEEYRNVEVCFIVNNKESNFRAIVPYRPEDPDLKNHVREIKFYPGIAKATYRGENRNYK